MLKLKLKHSRYTAKKRQRYSKISSRSIIGFSFVLILGGSYLLILNLSPRLINFLPIKSVNALNLSDDVSDSRDRIQIAKINLEVPIFTGKDARTLSKGVWNRYPERGDPIRGGNYILSAHRFQLGLTPSGTKAKSPFYNIDKLAVGDKIRVFYKSGWYNYHITKIYSVKPEQTSIEAPSTTAKLTLYTCSLKGSADGRVVVESEQDN